MTANIATHPTCRNFLLDPWRRGMAIICRRQIKIAPRDCVRKRLPRRTPTLLVCNRIFLLRVIHAHGHARSRKPASTFGADSNGPVKRGNSAETKRKNPIAHVKIAIPVIVRSKAICKRCLSRQEYAYKKSSTHVQSLITSPAPTLAVFVKRKLIRVHPRKTIARIAGTLSV